MLEMAGVTANDVVYDLGCGDGRIVVEAAKRYGARGVGIDIDIQRCKEARERAESAGVSRLVEIRHEDVLESDFSDATVVTLYLLPAANQRLRPKLEALKPGTRIVGHDFGIGDWKPLREEVVWVHDTDRQSSISEVGKRRVQSVANGPPRPIIGIRPYRPAGAFPALRGQAPHKALRGECIPCNPRDLDPVVVAGVAARQGHRRSPRAASPWRSPPAHRGAPIGCGSRGSWSYRGRALEIGLTRFPIVCRTPARPFVGDCLPPQSIVEEE
jgi:SAM-dependent methyltransferase